MRNLKKILALVLALVMSLSLMAVANAAEFPDSGDVSDVYAESVDVLTSLKVFQGNKGNLLPKDNITRAEVAAIIYRIATGDVEDTQKGIYADYNKFSDVTSDAWYAGYVNYCANAEYVKGVGGGKFAPQQNVTGYEALAMILRAIGYDKNNEFTGPSWQIQTAATAKNRHITDKIAEGTLGGPATREVVAEILCKTILVPVADYSLAFGYRTTDANGKDNETLAKRNFDLEKISGVVLANEYAALDADTPLPAGQTKLELADDTTKTLEVASDLDAIGESRYVYVVPKAGTTRFDLVCSKLYGEENNNVYDNEGAKVASVGNSTGSANGITSIDGAEHFVNFSQNDEYETKIRIKYVMRARMSEYDAMVMYKLNGTASDSMLQDLTDSTETAGTKNTVKAAEQINGKDYYYIPYPSDISSNWNQLITSNAIHTYEYTKVIPAFTKLTDTDWANLRSIFANADRLNNADYVVGEVYVGTNSNTTFNLLTLTGSRDISDYVTWEKFEADYLNVKENKTQVTECGLGQHLKIVDNDNDGVAEYVLKTVYTVAVMAANGTSLDVSGVQLVDSKVRDNINSIPSATTPFFSTEGLAAGDVVVYSLIDGKIHATKAEGETVKINTVNRAAATATATGEDGKTWTESDVHTHSQANGLVSGVNGMVGNTTYSIYFDLYGNLAAYTEGANGGLTLITNGWYNNTISGPEYAIQAYVDGSLQTVTVGTNGSLFVGPRPGTNSNNTWGCLKTGFGTPDANGFGNINSANGSASQVRTIVANLDGNVLTPVDKTYLYSQNLRMLDMYEDVIPGRNTNSWAIPYATNYGVNNTAYQAAGNLDSNGNVEAGNRTYNGNSNYYEVRALSNTVYYTVYRGVGTDTTVGNTIGNNVVVRSYTGYNNVPSINKNYIEDVYAVGAKATTATNQTYYAAQVVVIELNSNYQQSRRDSEQVFIPDFAEVSNNIGIENVTMIRGNGEIATVAVDMTKSRTSDQYDTAGGTTRNARRAGLYYMDPSDSDPNVYVVQRMTPAQIRADNYMAGYVRESYAVLSNNYAQVEMMVQPTIASAPIWSISGFGSNTTPANWTLAQNTRPLPGSAYGLQGWQSKAVTADSKTYTYGGSTATLKLEDAAIVLSQGGNGDAGTTVNGLNERWDGANAPAGTGWPCTQANFNTINRNEVLVRYDAAGNVIWAVSFNETNAAQMVWWNSLPSATDDAGIRFWGNADTDKDKRIIIDHSQVLDGSRFIDFGNAIGTTIESYEIYPVVGGVVSTTPMSRTDELAKTAPGVGLEQYQVVVSLSNGTRETYTLTKNEARRSNDLSLATANTNVLDGRELKIPPKDSTGTNTLKLTLKDYIKMFTVSPGAKVEWTFSTGANATTGTVYAVISNDQGDITKIDNDGGGTVNSITTDMLQYIRAVVTSEYGDKKVYSSDPSTEAGLVQKTITAVGGGGNVAQWSLDGTTWNNTPVLVDEGTAVYLRENTSAGAAAATGVRLNVNGVRYANGSSVTLNASDTVTFETIPTITVQKLVNAGNGNQITALGSVTPAASLTGVGREKVQSGVTTAAGWVLNAKESNVEVVAGAAANTWDIYVTDMGAVTSALTVNLFATKVALNEETVAKANALVPSDADYVKDAAGTTTTVDINKTIAGNNVAEFEAVHENYLYAPAAALTGDYVATSVNLGKAVPASWAQYNSFQIIQRNEALKLYDDGNGIDKANGTKTKVYDYEVLNGNTIMAFLMKVGANDNVTFVITPGSVDGGGTFTAATGVAPVTLVVDNNVTFAQ